MTVTGFERQRRESHGRQTIEGNAERPPVEKEQAEVVGPGGRNPTIRELRARAKALRIEKWSRLSKDDLLVALREG